MRIKGILICIIDGFVFKSLLLGIMFFCSNNPYWKHYHVTEGNNDNVSKVHNIYIGLADVLILLKHINENIMLVDVRNEQAYREGHIPTALAYGNIKKMDYDLNDKQIVVYGNKTQLEEIKNDIVSFLQTYTTQIMIYSGGWEEWTACALNIEK